MLYRLGLPILSLLMLSVPFWLVDRRLAHYRLRVLALMFVYWGITVVAWAIILGPNVIEFQLPRAFVPKPHYVWSLEVRP